MDVNNCQTKFVSPKSSIKPDRVRIFDINDYTTLLQLPVLHRVKSVTNLTIVAAERRMECLSLIEIVSMSPWLDPSPPYLE